MKIADILLHCAHNDFGGCSCAEFINRELRIPADNWDAHITRLLPQFQTVNNVAAESQEAFTLLVSYLENLQKALRFCKVETIDDFKSFFERDGMNTQNLSELISIVKMILRLQSPDIAGIISALQGKELPTYLLPYIDITATSLAVVPARVGVNGSYVVPSVNAKLSEPGVQWIFSTVTSNLDEDRLLRKNQKRTTMNSRKRLYPIFTQIGPDKLALLHTLIPNYEDTCIASIKCKVISVFK